MRRGGGIWMKNEVVGGGSERREEVGGFQGYFREVERRMVGVW